MHLILLSYQTGYIIKSHLEVRLSAQLLNAFSKKWWGGQGSKGKKAFGPFGVQLCFYVSSFLEVCLTVTKTGHGMGLIGPV